MVGRYSHEWLYERIRKVKRLKNVAGKLIKVRQVIWPAGGNLKTERSLRRATAMAQKKFMCCLRCYAFRAYTRLLLGMIVLYHRPLLRHVPGECFDGLVREVGLNSSSKRQQNSDQRRAMFCLNFAEQTSEAFSRPLLVGLCLPQA
jgi:hypothetical protein